MEVNSPDNLEDLAIKTDLSFYVKGVGQTPGSPIANVSSFLFYLGTVAPGSHDFMAIEVLRKGVKNLNPRSESSQEQKLFDFQKRGY